jgi:hypothetical protein
MDRVDPVDLSEIWIEGNNSRGIDRFGVGTGRVEIASNLRGTSDGSVSFCGDLV